MATPLNDHIIVQRGNISGGGGDDTFIFSGFTVEANEEITISDTQGTNRIQLIAGLSITSTLVTDSAAQLFLNNGAKITLLDADAFTFEVGGNPLLGDAGSDQNFTQFVGDTLNSTVPGAGESPVTGGSVVIPEPDDTPDFNSEININGSGTSDAAADNIKFNIDQNTSYSHTINNFASGDYLDLAETANDPTIQNEPIADGKVDLTITDATLQTVVEITLTGLSNQTDLAIFNLESFQNTFGSNVIL